MPTLAAEQIASFFALETVQSAKRQIDARESGSVYFTVAMTETLKAILQESFGLNLPSTTSVPMRWIKGDTPDHVDVDLKKEAFDTTYLLYLTDSPGELILAGKSHPITKGTAYTFPESLHHETINTGSEPRLLLGPMSEEGFAVGAPTPTTLTGPGGTTIYIRQFEGSYEYSSDQINWFRFATPTTVINTDIGTGNLTIEFASDFTFTSADNYFICGSSHIQFGSTSLKEDGSRPIITIDGVTGYPGLIQNGTDTNDGQSNINVYNLAVDVSNGSILIDDAGWIGQAYFGKAVANNYIVNCSSDGPISENGGGIVGRYAGSEIDANLTLIGCSSSGEISDSAGGLVGRYAGNSSGSISCEYCWSTGSIGVDCGGITGEDTYNATITNCYSTGAMDDEGGGICGQDCNNSTITNCYSTGSIGSEAGGIVGRSSDTVMITNCYSVGSISSLGGGIVGQDSTGCIITNCYTAGTVTDDLGYIIGDSNEIPATCFSEAFTNAPGGTWNSVNTIDILLGGTIWTETVLNTPYELTDMGYTPYTIANIDITGAPTLQRIFAGALTAGSATAAAIVSGRSYTVLRIAGGDPDSYTSITMDATTGVISTTTATIPGAYAIYLRNTGSYNITVYELTVGEAPLPPSTVLCCERTTFRRGPIVDNTTYTALVAGNTYIGSVRRGPVPYSQIMARKKAQASKH